MGWTVTPDELKSWGIREQKVSGEAAIGIPYFDQDGAEVAVNRRISLTGSDRLRFRSGDKKIVYGLWKLDQTSQHVYLIEGESDAHTAWHHGFNAVGIPGASSWSDTRHSGLSDAAIHNPGSG